MELDLKKLKNIHIIGILGLEGWAMLDFFLTQGFENITAHDFIKESEFRENFIKNHPGFSKKALKKTFSKLSIYKKRIKIFYKKSYLKEIDKADFIFCPQSWFLYKENRPLFKVKKKIPFLGIINIYFALAPAKIIGITGSCGKTTTSRLIYHIFKKLKKKIYYGGNDKKAVQSLSEIPKMKKKDFLILEVSHRHLMNFKNPLSCPGRELLAPQKTPFIAVILNISKNHLDEVKSLKKYRELKKRILFFQKEKDFAILNYDDISVRSFSKEAKSQIIFFSKTKSLKEGVFWDKRDNFLKVKRGEKETRVIKKEELSLQAQSYLEDVLAAIAVSFLAKIKPKIIKKAIQSFSWPKNCLEYLGNIKGIKYYNNLASATPEATERAIEALMLNKNLVQAKNLILLTGGKDKKSDYRKLVKKVKKSIKFLILFPDSVSKQMEKLFSQKERKLIKKVSNLKEAITFIKEKSKEGDTVLLSPSGAFFQSKYGRKQDFLRIVSSY